MSWPRIRPENDDGICSTHFSYVWSPETAQSQMSMAMGFLPEMHVWVGILDTQEIVDFSTRHLRKSAETMGFTWESDDPPPYVWENCNKLPSLVFYNANKTASLLAHYIIQPPWLPPCTPAHWVLDGKYV